MEFTFTKEEIIASIEYLDKHPEEFVGRGSYRYDLSYNSKMYPPILVLSKANELKGGEKLTLDDFNRNTEIAFKFLTDLGFIIVNKTNSTEFSSYLHEFIDQSSTSNLSW